MLFWNADNKELHKIRFQYSKNKMFYEAHKPSINEICGDQKVILESNVKYKFFPIDKIRYFKFIKEEDRLDSNISIIVCNIQILFILPYKKW